MRAILRAIALCALVSTAVAQNFPSERIHGFGNKANRINLVIVGDGWSQADIDAGKYKKAVNDLKNGLLQEEPLKMYQNFLTITRVDVPSARSGVSFEYEWYGEYGPGGPPGGAPTGGVTGTALPTGAVTNTAGLPTFQFAPATWVQPRTNKLYRPGMIKGTYYQTYFYTSRDASDNIVMVNRSVWFKDNLADGNKDNRWVYSEMKKKVEETNKDLPRHVTAVLVNSEIPGGAAVPGVFCFSNESHIVKTFTHELGHALAKLGDEYVETGNEPTSALKADSELPMNVTTQSNKNLVKWKHWYGSEGIGDPVEGGLLRSKGVWRPKDNCMMRQHWAAPFCAVCKEETVRRFLTHVSLIDTVDPLDRFMRVRKGDSKTFKVHCVGPRENKIEGQFFIDGKPVKTDKTDTAQGPVFQATLGPDVLVTGVHVIRCVVNDKTPLIKDAKEGVEAYKRRPNQRNWYVQVRDEGLLPTLIRFAIGGIPGVLLGP